MTHIGFTGIQRGTTHAQRNSVAWLLENLDGTDFHHGKCIGADIEVDEIARRIGYRIHLHAATTGNKQALCDAREGVDTEYPAKPPLTRNQDIVDAVETMIATPGEMTEQVRSGTWSTVRKARKARKRLFIVLPDGSIREFGG